MKSYLTQTGFTLIELLISIAIIVILSTIGIASFNSSSSKNVVQQQAAEIRSLARKLRTDAGSAIKPSSCPTTSTPATNSSVYGSYITFWSNLPGDPSTISYGISCWDGSGTDRSPIASSKTLPAGIKITAVGAGAGVNGVTIFYTFDGKVIYFNCEVECGTTIPYPTNNNLNKAPNLFSLVNVSATDLPVTLITVRISDSTVSRDYQINFSRTGLVCEQKYPLNTCAI